MSAFGQHEILGLFTADNTGRGLGVTTFQVLKVGSMVIMSIISILFLYIVILFGFVNIIFSREHADILY